MSRSAFWRSLYCDRLWWFQRQKRDERPSVMYVGKRGRGKSLCLTEHVIEHLREGRVVIGNYSVVDRLSGRATVACDTLRAMMDVIADCVAADRPFTVVIDEAQNVFDAREWQRTPAWFRSFLSEIRHYRGCLLMATQVYTMVEKRARQLADSTYRVRPIIKGLHHRLAFFRLTEIEEDFESVTEDAQTFGATSIRWIRGGVYGAYSTMLLPADDAVGADDGCSEIYARIRATLTERGDTPPSLSLPDLQSDESASR